MRGVVLLLWLVAACTTSTPEVAVDAPVAIDADEPLGAPTLVATPGDSQVSLTWDAVPNAISYYVVRMAVPGGPRTMLTSTTQRSARDVGLTNGTTYYYAVQARDARGPGPWSAEIAATPVEALPLAPTNVTARAGRDKVTIGWQTASDASSYVVRRATTSGGPYATIAAPTAPPHVDTTVVDGATYYYVVHAHNTGGDSAPSLEAAATPTTAIPAVPTGLSQITGKHETTLAWDPTAAATAYRVERSWSQTGPWGFAGLTRGLSITIADVFGSAYFRVVAVSAAGEGDPSAPILASPSSFYLFPVSSLTGRASPDAVTLAWSADSQMTTFDVMRSTTQGGPYQTVASTSANYYQDSGLAAGTYFYVVRATNKPSANSNELTLQVSPARPPRPSGLVVENNGYAVTLRWQPVAGASHYVVRRTHNRLEPAIIAQPLAPRYSVYLDDANDVYAVSAVVNGVESAGSELVASVAGAPAVPSLGAHAGAERIVLSWSAAQVVTLYRADGETVDYAPIFTGAATVFVDDTVVPGAAYRYRLRATYSTGVAWSAELAAQLSPARPRYPTNLRVDQAGYHWAEIAWDPIPGARGYIVYIQQPGSGLARASYALTPRLKLNQVEPGTLVRVSAYSAAGEGAPSDAVVLATETGAPARAPEQLHVATGDRYAYLTWMGLPAEAFSVRRSESPNGPFTEVGTGSYAFFDDTLTNGVTYYYVVAAVGGGSELVSAPIQARPASGAPAAPTITSVIAGDNEVELTWASVPGAYQYFVFRGTTAGDLAFYTRVARPHFIDQLAYAGSTYVYAVRAVTLDSIESASSPEVDATPAAQAQDRVGASASNGMLASVISWTPSPGATGYRIWRTDGYWDPWVAIADVGADTQAQGYRDTTPGTHLYAVSALGPNGPSVMSEPYTGTVHPSYHAPIEDVAVDTSGGAAIVSWTGLGRGVHYEVCWRSVDTGARRCDSTSRSSHALQGWSAGDRLAIYVRPRQGQISYVYFTPSPEVIATTTGGAPAVPTITGYSGNPRITLTWNPSAGATAYRVWRADRADDRLQPVATTTDPRYVSPDLYAGTPYVWAVSAIGAGGESNWSAALEVGVGIWMQPLTAPIVATGHAAAITFDLGMREIDRSWSVFVEATPGAGFTPVTPLARYRGRIVVPASAGTRTYMLAQCESSWCSNVRFLAAAPSASAPATIAGLSDFIGNGEVTLTWTPVPGATSYRIYRGPGDGIEGTLVPIADVTAPPFTDRDTPAEMVSTYTVTVIGGGHESAIAPPVATFPTRDSGWAPTAVTATSTAAGIQVTWDSSLGATSYQVCRSATPGTSYSTCVTATSPYLDTTAQVGTLYSYVVRANGSAYSPAANAIRDPP